MKATAAIIAAVSLVALMSVPASGYWVESMGHKMHHPQFPDPNGWDIHISGDCLVGDDWQCSQSGPVDDIHFWASWQSDQVGQIGGINVGIFSNVPASDDAPSHPGIQLWSRNLTAGEFVIHEGGEGQQGWYNPCQGQWEMNEHSKYIQINIVDIPDPFPQKRGEIYWLVLNASTDNGRLGWKTSQDHFMDDAAYRAPGAGWQELTDPSVNTSVVSLDMAFVITPEPATAAVLCLGGAAALLRRRRR